MKKSELYLLVLWYGIKSKLRYRIGASLDALGKALEILTQFYLWMLLVGGDAKSDTSLLQMMTYLLLMRLTGTLTSSTVARTISNRIRDGSISTDFLLPISLKWKLLCTDLGSNLFRILVVYLPIGVLCALSHKLLYPSSFFHALGFAASLFLGCLLSLQYNYILGLVSFWLLRNPFYKWHFRNIEQIFAGTYFPIWFYPAWLETVTRFLPFRYFAYEPVALYLGKTPIAQAGGILCMQLLWLCILLLLEQLVWQNASKKVVIQGG